MKSNMIEVVASFDPVLAKKIWLAKFVAALHWGDSDHHLHRESWAIVRALINIHRAREEEENKL